MTFLTWIFFGFFLGIGVHIFDRNSKGVSILGAIVLGIVGALTGGVLANLIFELGSSVSNLPSFMSMIGGSLALLYISKMIRTV